MASIRFLGAAGTVTGSRYLLTAGGRRVLVDAGLFQGLKELRLRNWAPFPVDPASIDAVVLTHAHIDHAGALPLLAREGLRAPVYCTPATRDLSGLLLPDSGRRQEEEARNANFRGYSKHAPQARPLYSEADAIAALRLLAPIPYGAAREILPGISVTLHRAGHILGSATAEIALAAARTAPLRLLFSGDLGRYGAPILPDPEPPPPRCRAGARSARASSSRAGSRSAPPPPAAARSRVAGARRGHGWRPCSGPSPGTPRARAAGGRRRGRCARA